MKGFMWHPLYSPVTCGLWAFSRYEGNCDGKEFSQKWTPHSQDIVYSVPSWDLLLEYLFSELKTCLCPPFVAWKCIIMDSAFRFKYSGYLSFDPEKNGGGTYTT